MPNSVATSILSGTIADANLVDKGTAGNYGPTANATLAYSGTFLVPYITTDAKGRVTAEATRTMTMPGAPTTAQSLVTAGTITVSGTATATVGGITTTTAPTYTSGGNVTVTATVPLATSTAAGAITPAMWDILEGMTPAGKSYTDAFCVTKYGTGAHMFTNRSCYKESPSNGGSSHASYCLGNRMMVAGLYEYKALASAGKLTASRKYALNETNDATGSTLTTSGSMAIEATGPSNGTLTTNGNSQDAHSVICVGF